MTLLDFIHILSRRKWVIILTAFFTLLVFALAVFNTPPKYTATSSVRILTTRSGSADYVEYNVDYSTRVMNTYKELATSAPVLEELGQYVSPIPKLEVNIVPDSELIEISATDIDPGLAQFAANKLGDLIVEQSKLMSSSNEPPVTAYVAEPAVLPDKPSSPSPYMLIGLGLVVGLIGGLALAFVFESLDTRLYTAKQIEAVTNLSTIGDIPDFNGKNSKQQLYIFERQVGAESIRRLSANILSVMREKDIKSFLVTSPVPRDGRSAIVANLAISLAQTKRKVLVIDADMRNPKMHEIFGMTNTDGLTRLLTLKQDASKTINSTGFEGVDLLSSGPRPANPIEILDTSEIQKLIHYLEKRYDVILLDSPPCLSVTDAVIVASRVGGVLVVVREGWVRREVLENTLNQLHNVNANIIGVIVNRTSLGASIKSKVQIQPEKNGSAPRGKERDLRETKLPDQLVEEPKSKDQKASEPTIRSDQRQQKHAKPESAPVMDMRIPRPPREAIMPEASSHGPEKYSYVIQEKDTSESIISEDQQLKDHLSDREFPKPSNQEDVPDIRDHRKRDMRELYTSEREIQERVVREPERRERAVRQPGVREHDLPRRAINESELRQRIVRQPVHRRRVPYESDLDYERYLRERELYMRDPRQRWQREQELNLKREMHEHGEREFQHRDRRDQTYLDRDSRYSSLDDLDINGIDEYPKSPKDAHLR